MVRMLKCAANGGAYGYIRRFSTQVLFDMESTEYSRQAYYTDMSLYCNVINILPG